MSSVIRYLQDPETVAKFQRLCGVVGESIVHANATPPAGTPKLPNGIVTRHVKPVENGGLNAEEDISNVSSERQTEDVQYKITNSLLYYVFHFSANLGNEVFYLTFLPFWFWNIDGCVGRQLTTFWCIFMYIGQALKDVLQIPRPASPPVIQLEKRYALEYGMPSTHAMVGAGIPFAIYFLTKERYIYPSEFALLGAIIWCTLVCLSRIYLGMHTILDVVAGLTLIFVLMAMFLPFLGAIDHFLLYSTFSPAVCILVPLVLVVFYPTQNRWDTTRRDTTYILAAGSGISLGHWLSYQLGFMMKATTPPPYNIIPPTLKWTGLIFVRMSLGVGVLLSLRSVVARVSYRIACRMAGIDPSDRAAARRITVVDLSHKYFTYATLAMGLVFAPPALFHTLGIERETYFTEI